VLSLLWIELLNVVEHYDRMRLVRAEMLWIWEGEVGQGVDTGVCCIEIGRGSPGSFVQ